MFRRKMKENTGMGNMVHRVYIATKYFYYSLLTVSQVCVMTHFGYKVTNL